MYESNGKRKENEQTFQSRRLSIAALAYIRYFMLIKATSSLKHSSIKLASCLGVVLLALNTRGWHIGADLLADGWNVLLHRSNAHMTSS